MCSLYIKKIKNIALLVTSLFFTACVDKGKANLARLDCESLINDIENGKANSRFSAEYFPVEQTNILMSNLVSGCDFKNRRGLQTGEVVSKKDGKNLAYFVYEYYLKCDSIRFVFIYDITGTTPQLFNLKMEPIEKENPLVNKEKRLFNPDNTQYKEL